MSALLLFFARLMFNLSVLFLIVKVRTVVFCRFLFWAAACCYRNMVGLFVSWKYTICCSPVSVLYARCFVASVGFVWSNAFLISLYTIYWIFLWKCVWFKFYSCISTSSIFLICKLYISDFLWITWTRELVTILLIFFLVRYVSGKCMRLMPLDTSLGRSLICRAFWSVGLNWTDTQFVASFVGQ